MSKSLGVAFVGSHLREEESDEAGHFQGTVGRSRCPHSDRHTADHRVHRDGYCPSVLSHPPGLCDHLAYARGLAQDEGVAAIAVTYLADSTLSVGEVGRRDPTGRLR